MKFRRAKILAVIMLFAISIAPAAAQVMTGCEIRKAFFGNTVDGAWGAADSPLQTKFRPQRIDASQRASEPGGLVDQGPRLWLVMAAIER